MAHLNNRVSLQVRLSSACNVACNRGSGLPQQTHLDSEQFDRILNEVASYTALRGDEPGRAVVCGGNPTLSPILTNSIRKCRQAGFSSVTVLTNGTTMTSTLARELADAGCDRVQTCIEGDQETHDAIQGRSFDQVLDAWKICRDHGIWVINQASLHPLNHHLADAIVETCWERVDRVCFVKQIPHDPGLPSLTSSQWLGVLERMFFNYLHKGRDYRDFVHVKDIQWSTHFFDTGYECAYWSPSPKHVIVEANGDVYVCRESGLVVGNVFRDKLSDIYRDSSVLQPLRDRSSLGGKCSDCTRSDSCGGCRALALLTGEDIMAEDPYCVRDGLNEQITEHLRIDGSYSSLVAEVVDRRFRRELAERHGFAVSDDELQEAADAYRKAHGLFDADATHAWLRKNGIRLDALESHLEGALLGEKLKSNGIVADDTDRRDLTALVGRGPDWGLHSVDSHRYPDAAPLHTSDEVELLQVYLRAIAYLKVKDYAAAITLLTWLDDVWKGQSLIRYHLAMAHAAQGKYAQACGLFQSTLALQPDHPEAGQQLANALFNDCQAAAGLSQLREVLAADPGNQQLLLSYALRCALNDQLEEAREVFQGLVERFDDPAARIRLATLCPAIFPSHESILDFRKHLEEQLTHLEQSELQLSNPVQTIAYAEFFLAYQAHNDRSVKSRLSNIYRRSCGEINYTASHCREVTSIDCNKKLRIGFISGHLQRNHSIGRTSSGIIKLLDRKQFEVLALFIGDSKSLHAQAIAELADSWYHISPNLLEAQRQIEALQLDILFYQDIGMGAFSYFLAHSRLAPIQCTSFGHPETSGISSLDYYVSTRDWEPENGQQHYREKLVRLRNVASVAYYYRPTLPDEAKRRVDYGLRDENHIYICPQTLFKIHPDMDSLFREILRRDEKANIVLAEGSRPEWARHLRKRLEATLGPLVDRVVWQPLLGGGDFINLLMLADVNLDTLHFCGFNTTLEALAAGIPTVCLPGEFMRSRHGTVFYERLGIPECIASDGQDYVDIALRLANDADFRQGIVDRIISGRDDLWEETEVIREFERFFLQAASSWPESIDY